MHSSLMNCRGRDAAGQSWAASTQGEAMTLALTGFVAGFVHVLSGMDHVAAIAHGRTAFAVGTLHGLAGSSHLLGILPALAMPSDLAAGVYLLLFGTGSVAGMGTFASFVGWIAGWPRACGGRAQAVMLGLSSAITVVVGGFWIFSYSSFVTGWL